MKRLKEPAPATSVQNNNNSKNFENLKNNINQAIKQTPLHASVQWGLADITKCLLSNLNCKIYAQVIIEFLIYNFF